jgi:hypothetical protein
MIAGVSKRMTDKDKEEGICTYAIQVPMRLLCLEKAMNDEFGFLFENL